LRRLKNDRKIPVRREKCSSCLLLGLGAKLRGDEKEMSNKAARPKNDALMKLPFGDLPSPFYSWQLI
jgi:hypothetical protein